MVSIDTIMGFGADRVKCYQCGMTGSRSLELDHFLPYRLSYTANLISELIAGAYESLFGLTIPEWRVVAHAAEHDGISQQDICQRTRMDKVTVSRAAIALAARGLLARVDHPRDRRSRLLLLSAEGRALYAKIAPKALELERRVFGHFDEKEIDGFANMLRRIDAAIVDEMAQDTGMSGETGAGEGIRTLDPDLGKVVLYP
jgi:DNA-binding MarR family transcriptional regulator